MLTLGLAGLLSTPRPFGLGGEQAPSKEPSNAPTLAPTPVGSGAGYEGGSRTRLALVW